MWIPSEEIMNVKSAVRQLNMQGKQTLDLNQQLKQKFFIQK
jgi:hypothetical protein